MSAMVGATCKALTDQATAIQIDALPIHGCIFAGGQLDGDQAAEFDARVIQAIGAVGGLRVWHQRPPGAESILPFAPPQPDWDLLSRLKNTLDPQRLLNPGRFLAGKESAS